LGYAVAGAREGEGEGVVRVMRGIGGGRRIR
jgi:hypothetical protein